MSIVTIRGKTYTAESLYQWDQGRVLEIRGLSLATAPEIHFCNGTLDGAIVRQSTMDDAGVITANIPNVLLQKPYKIKVYICMCEGEKFRSSYQIEILVKPRSKPEYYTIEDKTEIYSIKALVAEVENTLEKYKDLSNQYEDILETVNNLSEDIEELKKNGNGSVSDEKITEAVENYMAENPVQADLPTVSEADNGKALMVVGGEWKVEELPKLAYSEVENSANGTTVIIGR